MEKTKKRHGSIKIRIMLPVLILGIAAVISNVTAISNIRKVNENASQIADHSMSSLTELSVIREQVQELHSLGLSHAVAIHSDAMIDTVNTIKTKEAELAENLANYKKYLDEGDQQSYEGMRIQCECKAVSREYGGKH